MTADGEFFKVEIPEQEIPVNPSPYVFYLAKDREAYNQMMRAIFTCMKVCAEAHSDMYKALIDAIPG